MAEVSRKLGYRLQLQTVTHRAVATPGGSLAWQVPSATRAGPGR